MKSTLPLAALTAGLLLGAPLLSRAESPPPASLFVREPSYWDVQVSPDGHYVGFIGGAGQEGLHHILVLLDLTSGHMRYFDGPAMAHGSENTEARGFQWVNTDRVAFEYGFPDGQLGGIRTVKTDGTQRQDLMNFNGGVFFTDNHSDRFLIRSATDWRSFDHPIIREVLIDDPTYGVLLPQRLVADDRQGVSTWIPDRDGSIRLGMAYDGETTRVLFRQDEDAPWVQLHDFDSNGLGDHPVAVDWDRHTAYTGVPTRFGTRGLGAYDLLAHRRGALVAADPVYDVLTPNEAGSGLLFSRKKQRLIGVRYAAATERTLWLDPEMAQIQASLDHAFPGMVNTISNWSDDESRIVVWSHSDRHPGVYYLLDKTARSLRKLFDAAPWIKPADMARAYPMSFRARDGLLVHGYVVLPAGLSQKNLPFIVVPNETLVFSRTVMNYDGFTQFLASRGYGILEVNPRGTPGFGKAFFDAGRGQAGGATQDDITDAVHWAIDRKLADPKRIAIVGARYGGFSAEWGISQEPKLYRCAVSIEGIADWPAMLKESNLGAPFFQKYDYENNSEIYGYLREEVGDPRKDAAMLRDISPINHVDRIKVPILLISYQQHEFQNLADQTELFAAALKRAGDSFEVKSFPEPKDNINKRQQVSDTYSLIEAFLDKHMAADSAPIATGGG